MIRSIINKGVNMDKYTKFILTIIAVGVLGLNFHLFKGKIVSPANASSHQVIKMTICNETGTRCAGINGSGNLRVYDFGGS